MKCDLLVIGGGTSGLRVAINAAMNGKKTILAEPGKLGGTCLNRGCIPTKAMIHAASLYADCKDSSWLGIQGKPTLNFNKLMQRVRHLVKEGRDHIDGSLPIPRLTILRSKARFLDHKRVQVGKHVIEPYKVIIATGGRPAVAPINGIDGVPYWTSDDIIKIKTKPRSLIILGGGYISMEFAAFFTNIGTKVTIVERWDRPLKALAPDMTSLLQERYEKRGVNFLLGTDVLGVRTRGKSVELEYKKGRKKHTVKADHLLVATGRAPNIDMDLDKAGIRVGKRDVIEVDSYLRTSNRNVFAIGDVNGRAPFAHAAKREGTIALHNAFSTRLQRMDWEGVPWAVFTDPPVAGVGVLPGQVPANHELIRAEYSDVGRAAVMGKRDGFITVYVEKGTGKILGCYIVGARADDLIHEYAAVMHSTSPTIDTIRKTIHIHPTLSEINELV